MNKTVHKNSTDLLSSEASPLEQTSSTKIAVFGITLTPEVALGMLAFFGAGSGVYLLLNQLMPAWSNNQKLQASLAQKQAQVQQKQIKLQHASKIQTELEQAKYQQTEVLAMFANQKTLNTLLLDLNRLIESANAKLNRNSTQAKLQRFVPVNQSAEVITDGSLGLRVNGKLQRQSFNIAFSGTFSQTETILRNIERLQPLLTVKDYQSTLAAASPTDALVKVVRGPATINTSLQLQALIPVNS